MACGLDGIKYGGLRDVRPPVVDPPNFAYQQTNLRISRHNIRLAVESSGSFFFPSQNWKCLEEANTT